MSKIQQFQFPRYFLHSVPVPVSVPPENNFCPSRMWNPANQCLSWRTFHSSYIPAYLRQIVVQADHQLVVDQLLLCTTFLATYWRSREKSPTPSLEVAKTWNVLRKGKTQFQFQFLLESFSSLPVPAHGRLSNSSSSSGTRKLRW